jgi:hypothetical protein
MSDHAWTLDNVAAYVAGGLSHDEDVRLEGHAAECPECAAALDQARALDQKLDVLFADRRPGPALEDRMIRSLREESARAVLRGRWFRKLAFGAAAAAVLGATGAGTSRIMDGDELPFPGTATFRSLLAANSPEGNRLQGAPTAGLKPPNVPAVPGDGSVRYARNADEATIPDADQMAQAIAGETTYRSSKGAPVAANQASLARNIYGRSDAEEPAGGIAFSRDGSSNTLHADPFVPRQISSGKSKDDPAPSEDYFKPETALYAQPPGESKASGDGKGPAKSGPEAPPGPDKPKGSEAPKTTDPVPDSAPARKVIRTGEIEFEVDSFDGALAAVIKLVNGIKGGYVGTVNSDKLANGKVKGSIVVRVPPDTLDSLVLDLRRDLGKLGELKGQRVKSEDVTKQYTDLESRLKAARTMEQRLLQIIKEGKGEIKQLLEAEKELGVWRTKIEEFEGEIRYYANQVALSTLTITLAEKEIRAAADVVESERVQAGVEVEDVDKSYREALAAVTDARGRVTKSEVKQHSAGQFSAVLQFEVTPDAAGPLRDRLRQLGNLVRLEIDRVQQAEGGTTPPRDAKVRRGDTRFDVQLYNLAKVAPRETATVQLAVADVPAGYRALREAVEQVKGRVVTAQLNEQDRRNVTAQLDFEVRRADEAAVQATLGKAGEVLSRNVVRAPEAANMTDGKVLIRTALVSAAAVPPRLSVTLALEVADVDAAGAVFSEAVTQAQGRVIDAQVAHERSGRDTARLTYDVPLSAAAGLIANFKAAGTVRVDQATRNAQAPEGKLALARIEVTLSNSELIVPNDAGLGAQVKKGLTYSWRMLSWSVMWLVFGLCVVLPWALVGYGGYRLVRRLFGSPAPAPTPTTQPPAV